METIGDQTLWSFSNGALSATPATCTQIRNRDACEVLSFMGLARKVAELQFLNRDFVLLFRGQTDDYKNRAKNTSLKPSLFRANDPEKVPAIETLQTRFETLRIAEGKLTRQYRAKKLRGIERLERQQILRWAILQHYEVCETPLLDVTHSLRIAASFASLHADDEAYVFVIGVPNLSGAITASAEAGLQIVRLSSVCPPAAIRPHIQEGYLIGEYPEMSGIRQKQHYFHYEMDSGRRLIAKFVFNPKAFWKKSSDFPPIGKDALYPNRRDNLFALAESIKSSL